jgi:hypothetical protein
MMSDHIGWILAQASITRQERNVDPWKSIEEVQSANWGTPPGKVQNVVAKAVRKARSESAKASGTLNSLASYQGGLPSG